MEDLLRTFIRDFDALFGFFVAKIFSPCWYLFREDMRVSGIHFRGVSTARRPVVIRAPSSLRARVTPEQARLIRTARYHLRQAWANRQLEIFDWKRRHPSLGYRALRDIVKPSP